MATVSTAQQQAQQQDVAIPEERPTEVKRAEPVTPQVAQERRKTPANRQLGRESTSPLNVWGPFAGYGQRGRHASWLLDNVGDRADELHEAVTEGFSNRDVPGARMGWKRLTAQGLVVERRPFYFVQRGICTVALYIARFGRDLYISQVTYVKSPISFLRVALVSLLVLFYVWFQIFYPVMLTNRLGSINFLGGMGGIPWGLICVIGPLGLVATALFWLVVLYSAYKLLRDRDILAILRKPPNEFEKDDIVALEKAVEETVRQSLDAINIDRARMPESQERSFGTRARLI